MSEFCQQCSIVTWGKDLEEFKGLTTKEDWAAGKAALVICEGCGVIQVDPDGKCVSEGCLENHNPPKETKK